MKKNLNYSPDLAPSDNHLSRSMAQCILGRNFSNIEEVEIDVQEFFASKSKEWFCSGIAPTNNVAF